MNLWVIIFQIENKYYMARNSRSSVLLKLLLVAIMLLTVTTAYTAEGSQNISAQRQAELHNLLLQDCGSCHGMTMKGGLGPALTADVLKNKSRQMIELTILRGRPGTPMPPWDRILTKEEVRWIVDKLYSGVTL